MHARLTEVTSRISCAAAALLLVTALPAAAQQTSVPREFIDVLWLLSSYDGSEARLHVGSIPETLHGIEPGRGVRVIGAVTRRAQTTAAIAVRAEPAAAQQEWESRLERAGWTRRPPRPGEQRTGFVDSRYEEVNRGFCWPADDASLQLRTVDAPGDETYLVFTWTAPRRGACTAPAAAFEPDPRGEILPSLPPPPGAIVIGTGGGGSADNRSQNATLHTELSPAALLAHYGRAMREQGWTALEESAGEQLAVSAWRRRGEGNAMHVAWLSAMRMGGNHRDMQVRVLTVAETGR